jgi:hypothetical protein
VYPFAPAPPYQGNLKISNERICYARYSITSDITHSPAVTSGPTTATISTARFDLDEITRLESQVLDCSIMFQFHNRHTRCGVSGDQLRNNKNVTGVLSVLTITSVTSVPTIISLLLITNFDQQFLTQRIEHKRNTAL